jgi:hypothetical protein
MSTFARTGLAVIAVVAILGGVAKGAILTTAPLDLTDVTATGNDTFGVRARRVMLTDGTVTGNSQADVASDRPPQLVNLTCGTSLQPDTSGSWGVCTDD